MISRIRIKNFKCLEDVDVELRPFTVLIGLNDSGKSSFLEAFWLLGKLAFHDWSPQFSGDRTLDKLVWQRDTSRTLQWHVEGEAEGKAFHYALGLRPGFQNPVSEELAIEGQLKLVLRPLAHGAYPPQHQMLVEQVGSTSHMPCMMNHTGLATFAQHRFDDPTILAVARTLASVDSYRLFPEALRRAAALEERPILTPTGDNIVAVLDQIMTSADRAAINELEQVFHTTIPTLRSIALQTIQSGTKGLAIALKSNGNNRQTIPGPLASDGALLLLAFLALAYGESPNTILIEEPENGFHYSRLKVVIDTLRRITKGEVGPRARQIILTTHSPVLLNLVEPAEVRIFQRPEGGGTTVTAMDKVANIDNLLKMSGPGELWMLLGEEALVRESAR